jgi:hypothetical protein
MKTPRISWKTLSPISDDRLFEARAQLHQAAQLLAATGISFLEARPDDSHTAMLWSAENGQLLSQPFGDNGSLQIALDPASLDLTIQKEATVIHTIILNGITLTEAAVELQFSLDTLGLSKDDLTMQKHYILPDYPERNNTIFDISDSKAFQALADTFTNAFTFFDKIRQFDPRSSDLLVWPHHFDLGLILTMATDEQGQMNRSIGMGLSPGDGSYTAPYYYVTNWPAPTTDELPADLKNSVQWHTEDWVGMVLPLEAITVDSEPHAQYEIVKAFLDEALSIAKTFSEQK